MKKEPFALQVAIVLLLLVAGVLCIPLPDGGLLFHHLTGHAPEPDNVVTARATPVPPPVYNVTQSTAPPPHTSSARFRDELPFTEAAGGTTDGWTKGAVNGKPAWRDDKSGMIWGSRLDMSLSSFSSADLNKAKRACAAEAPRGSWSVPTAAEFDLAKVNGILEVEVDADAKHRWLSTMDMPNLTLPALRGYVAVSGEKTISVRCIGRSPSAPVNGYKQVGNDITLKAYAQ